MESLDISIYNITLINCNYIFANTVSDNIINDLYKYDLLNYSLTNKNIRQLVMHYTLYALSERILHGGANKHILFMDTTQIPECSMHKFFKRDNVLKELIYIIRKLKLLLPINVYSCKHDLTYIAKIINDKKIDNGILINSIQSCKKDFNGFTFAKAIAYGKQNNLKWLTDEYFKSISTKLLLIK